MADPRLTTAAQSVNEKAQDRAVRHLMRLLKLQNNEAQKIVRFLEDQVLPDLLDKISGHLSRMELSGGAIRGVEARRLQELSKSLDTILDQLGSESGGPNSLRNRLADKLTDIADTESKWAAKMLDDVIPIQVNTTLPSVDQLRTLVMNQPFDGAPLGEWFSNLGRSAKDNIMQQVRIGMTEGEGMDQIIRRIKGRAANNYTDGVLRKNLTRHAEAITRSAVIHSSQMAQMEFFRQNDDLVKELQWVATLDTRTCEQCMGLDSQTFPLEKGPRPPVHIQCRCVLAPVIKSWRELGIDLDEAPPGTRASMNGQVPESMTYKQWLKKQTPQIQKEALGPGKYKLWKNGDVDIGDFVNDQGQILTLQQLKEQEGLVSQAEDNIPQFSSASSKKEAEQLARNLGFSDVNYNGFDLATANAINEGAFWAAQRFGQKVAGDVTFKKTASKKMFGRLQQRYKGRRGGDHFVEKEYNFSTLGLRVGEVNDRLSDYIKRSADSGFLSKGASIQSTSAHEMGHYYMTRIYDKRYGKTNLTRSELDDRVKAWRNYEVPNEIIDDALSEIGKGRDYMDTVYETLGDYSKHNPHETISMAIQYEYDNPGTFDFANEVIKQMKAKL